MRKCNKLRMKDVMFVKNARKNLISVKKLCEGGAEVKFKGEMFEAKFKWKNDYERKKR